MSVQELTGIAETSSMPTDKAFVWLGSLAVAYFVVWLFRKNRQSPP